MGGGGLNPYDVSVTIAFSTKRVYDDPEPADGWRVLVDRLWPRGLTKEAAALDAWAKDAAPSAPLRTWFGHDPAKFAEFGRRYVAELEELDSDAFLPFAPDTDRVTLLFAARDPRCNHAEVLADFLRRRV